MNEFRLQLKLKDGQNLGYIQMRNGKSYYDYGYSEATLFDPVGVLNLLNSISLDKYDVYAEVPYTTNKGRKGITALKNEELKTYMKNELGKVQVMENKNMNEKMIDKYGREVDPKEWEEKEAKGLNEADEQFAPDAEGALADFLGTDVENVSAMNYDHYGIPMYEADGEEWAVTDDYNLVEDAAKEEVIQLIDEMGVDALNWDNMGGIENYLTGADQWYWNAEFESMREFSDDELLEELEVVDMNPEDYGWDGEQFQTDPREDIADRKLENAGDDIVEFIADNFGKDYLDSLIKNGEITLDSEKAAQECLDVDGPGHLLSSYDGNMVEHEFEGTTFYMFRQN